MSLSQIRTNEYEGMLSPKDILEKYPQAANVRSKRGQAISVRTIGRLVNWGIIEGSAFPYGGCVVSESSFVKFVESRGIELTPQPKPF